MSDKHRALRDVCGGPTMLTGAVAGTVLFALARGVPVERITAATGLRPADLTQLDTRLPERHMPAIWRLLTEHFPGQAIALEMARSVPMSFFGPLIHATRYAPDLRTGLEMVVRYRSVMSSRLHVSLDIEPAHAWLRIRHPLDDEDDGHASELGLAIIARLIRELLGTDDALASVQFAHAPFGPRRDYAAFFGAPLRFDAPSNALAICPSSLARPLPERDPPRLRYVLAHLDLVRERLTTSESDRALAEIREAIGRNAEHGEYGVDALAARLGTTTRSLQRRVRRENTTLRALVDQAREANARQLLTDPRLSIAEVAFLLGYSTESSFRRAFKRWTGLAPTATRRA